MVNGIVEILMLVNCLYGFNILLVMLFTGCNVVAYSCVGGLDMWKCGSH